MKNQQRLMSLDALRGFDMFFIMGLSGLIVSLCALWPNPVTEVIASHMSHVDWDGLRHHDTIFPSWRVCRSHSLLPSSVSRVLL